MKRAALFFCMFAFASSGFSADKIGWLKDPDQALQQAKQTLKPLFVDVFADWCTWCHKLDQDVYTNPKFVQYMKNHVMLKVDSEDNGKGTHFAEKYQVTGLPTLLVLDSNGGLINRITGFMFADSLIGQIDKIERLLAKEQNKSGDLHATYELANEYIEREMYPEAQLRFAKIMASGSASKEQKERAQFSTALALYYQGKLQPALTALNTYYSTYKDGNSNEDALLLLSQVHIELNSNTKAMKYLREFMQKYPKSGNAVRAQQVLTALEKECGGNC
jgi:thioredoxin-related protein